MIQRIQTNVPLSVEALSVAYRGTPVLWDVQWAARKGAMTAIVGPNGAGKSTLLNAALGLIPKLGGDVQFWGQPFSMVRDRVAYVPQRETIDWDFPVTARDVVTMGATKRGGWWLPAWTRRFVDAEGARDEGARVDAALERVDMVAFSNRPIGELSGGQQQRIFLARALAQEAELLILDEPFAGVDVATEALLARELRRLASEGHSIIAVHHDLDSVETLFDDVLVLDDGHVIAQGPARDVLALPDVKRAFGPPQASLAAAE